MRRNKGKRGQFEQYLQQYPDLERWINRCLACGATGTRPDLPAHIKPWADRGAANLRRMLEPLELDDEGLCTTCQLAKGDSS